MGWTFEQYDSQPEWFLELLEAKERIDAEHNNQVNSGNK